MVSDLRHLVITQLSYLQMPLLRARYRENYAGQTTRRDRRFASV